MKDEDSLFSRTAWFLEQHCSQLATERLSCSIHELSLLRNETDDVIIWGGKVHPLGNFRTRFNFNEQAFRFRSNANVFTVRNRNFYLRATVYISQWKVHNAIHNLQSRKPCWQTSGWTSLSLPYMYTRCNKNSYKHRWVNRKCIIIMIYIEQNRVLALTIVW